MSGPAEVGTGEDPRQGTQGTHGATSSQPADAEVSDASTHCTIAEASLSLGFRSLCTCGWRGAWHRGLGSANEEADRHFARALADDPRTRPVLVELLRSIAAVDDAFRRLPDDLQAEILATVEGDTDD